MDRAAKLAVLSAVVAFAAVAGCAGRPPAEPSTPGRAVAIAVAPAKERVAYPDLAALYGADAGIYRTCAANQGVCHNDKEYPNLATLGAIVQTIRADCNVTRDDPRDVHDLCERRGDALVLDGEPYEIGGIAPRAKKKKTPVAFDGSDVDPTTRLVLRSAPRPKKKPAKRPSRARVVRDGTIDLGRVDIVALPKSKGTGLVDVQLVYDDDGLKVALPGGFEAWGGATDPLAIHFGDPNGNGVYGAALGGALVVPGHPEKSYLMSRLVDPSAGPLMPRANCCTWTKASLRALYCWIAGLAEDGSNALAPIDYASCPPGPREDVAYPEPGPTCETSGMCPVMPRASSGATDATWAAVYKKVLQPRCAGGACHTDAARALFDLKSEDAAYRASLEHVVPRAPQKSELFVRISPDLCKAPACTPMPLKAAPLDANARDLIKRWIERGAPRD